MKEIYLAGGCFWGTEHFCRQIRGVKSTEVGYANSNIESPSYQLVCTGMTDSVETVKVVFDETVLPLKKLIEIYFKSIDPTSLNKQGGDIGTQYRTGIYYVDSADKEIVESCISNLQKEYSENVVVESLPLKNYFKAEEYHQNYLINNSNGYCHVSLDMIDYAKTAN